MIFVPMKHDGNHSTGVCSWLVCHRRSPRIHHLGCLGQDQRLVLEELFPMVQATTRLVDHHLEGQVTPSLVGRLTSD